MASGPSATSVASANASTPASDPSSSPAADGAGNNRGSESTGVKRSSSPPTRRSSQPTVDKDKPRLTEQEKKNNHIASEQKRRAAIREGFDRLTELVPGLEGQGRSESVVLRKTVDFMRLKLQERRDLVAEVEARGGQVEDSLRR